MSQCEHGKVYETDGTHTIWYCVKEQHTSLHVDQRGRTWPSDQSDFTPVPQLQVDQSSQIETPDEAGIPAHRGDE